MHGRDGRHAGVPGRRMQRRDRGILREGEHQGVLPAAGADHEDAEFAGHERRSYVPWIVALTLAAAVVGGVVGGFTDLHVYRYAGQAVLDGARVYDADDPVTGLPFTYPPFAAVLMVPLALGQGGSPPRCGPRERGLRRGGGRRRTPGRRPARARLAGRGGGRRGARAGAGLAEPGVRSGQRGADARRPRRPAAAGRRSSGVLVGIVAGIKLTPLVFVVLLVLVGRRCAAGRAALAFAATVAVGFAVPGAGVVLDRRPGRRPPGRPAGSWPTTSRCPARWPGCSTARRRPCSGSASRGRSPSPSSPSASPAGGGATRCSARVSPRWPCWWPPRSRGRTTGCGPCPWRWSLWERSRWAAVAWTAVFVARPLLWPPWGEGREYEWGAATTWSATPTCSLRSPSPWAPPSRRSGPVEAVQQQEEQRHADEREDQADERADQDPLPVAAPSRPATEWRDRRARRSPPSLPAGQGGSGSPSPRRRRTRRRRAG